MTVGNIRVVSLRRDGTQADDDESVVRIDRANPVLGNPHYLRNKYDREERRRVIALYRDDLEADMRRRGPKYEAVEHLAMRLNAGENLALACWCRPLECHGDPIVEAVVRVAELLRDEQRPAREKP